MSVSNIEELFVEELKDLYSAELQLVRALPRMAKTSSSKELRDAFYSHLKETEGHVQRLEKAFQILERSPRGKSCHGMKGLVEEGAEMMKEVEKGATRDAAMIAAAQRVEHYEIAGYGTVMAYARLLGQDDIADLLEETLSEEKAADEKLGTIAEIVNSDAKMAA